MTVHAVSPAPQARVPARLGVDFTLVSLVMALAFGGIALSASARAFNEALDHGWSVGLFRSLIYLGVGLCVMVAVAAVDYRKLSHPTATWISLFAISILLIAALFSGEVNNTHRWIRIGGFSLQPSELAKPVLVLAIAAALTRVDTKVREWPGLAKPLMIGGWIAALVLAGRDLGTPVLMFAVTLALLVAAGARWKHLLGLAGSGTVLFGLFAWIEPYRFHRLIDFVQALRLEGGSLDAIDYQLKQSLIAIGSGGVIGKGFGSSSQKALFLPEADDDFIFAILCEELGLFGGLGVLTAFLVVAWRGMVAANRATDGVGRLIALGATWLLCGQALCHMAVVTGLVPTKGLPLPFVSTGGSSLIASCALVGLVVNVSLRGRRYGV